MRLLNSDFCEGHPSATLRPRQVPANPSAEYLVYQPKPGESFTVKLPEGTFRYEWMDPAKGTSVKFGEIKSTAPSTSFRAPFPGEAVLYLKR